MKRDPALAALLVPCQQGLLPLAEGPSLFLRARATQDLAGLPAPLYCVQPFKPWADALARSGWQVEPHLPSAGGFAQVLVLLPRQREEARALMAEAFAACRPGGWVVAGAANDEGAKALEGDFKRLAGGLDGQLGKYHCRVFWARRDAGRQEAALQAQWRLADAVRPVLDGQHHSRPGVFAWDRIDAGSALLARHLPSGLRGRAADLGAGWGFLALRLLQTNPQLSVLDLFEADARALALAEHNLAKADSACKLGLHWHDVTAGLAAAEKYDCILSNPPFHDTGKNAQPEIGQGFIHAAADALAATGRFFLVANAHLPYEHLLAERFAKVQVLDKAQGYKVLLASEARR